MVTVRTRKLGTCRLGKPHWNAGRRSTDKRWNRKVVSRGSVVTSVERLPIWATNSWALTLKGPSVSKATGKKSCVNKLSKLISGSCCSLIVWWLSVIFWGYRDTADKSTKFGMKLPQGLLINASLGAIRCCLKIVYVRGPLSRKRLQIQTGASIPQPKSK